MDKHKNHFSIHVWLPELTRTKGGIQTFSQELVHALRRNVGEFSISIFVKNDMADPKDRTHAGFTCWRSFGYWPKGLLRTAFFSISILAAAWRDRPQLILVGHVNFSRLAAWLLDSHKIPFLVIVHGVEVWGRRGTQFRRYLDRANRILSVSRFTRNKLMSEQHLNSTAFSLLPNTFDENRFRPGPRSERLLRAFRVPLDRKIILTVCRLIDEELSKGYDQIIAALLTLRSSIPDVHFVLAGTGDDAARIHELIKKKNLQNHVTLTGLVPDEQLVDLYNSCDVFALPSCHEGFGIVFLEALACGKPVLGGNRDGAVDALCDGELGVLVDPDNIDDLALNLVRLLKGEHLHPLVYRPVELRARVIEEFGRERFAERVAGLLHEFKQTQMK